MNNLTEIKLKYMLSALIWLGAFVLAGLMILSGALSSGDANFLMGGALFIGAAIATGALFNWGQIDENAHKREEAAEKRKNEQRSIDPLSLLTDDDVAALREEIKMDVRRRLLQSEEGELNSLDALVAGDKQPRRR